MAIEPWVVLVHSLALFVVAAKTHGRQIRLERELRGHLDVQFGAGTNPPFVEALWRRDRIRFWTLTPILSVALLALAWLLPLASLPLSKDLSPQSHPVALGLLGGLLWGPTLSFLTLATLSARRLRHDLRAADKHPEGYRKPPAPRWRRDAVRGSVFWFCATAVLAAGTLGFAYL